MERNKDSTKRPWKLSGLLIGNGWISPVDHYLSYIPFAYAENLLSASSESAKRVESQLAICTKMLNEGGKDHVDTPECEKIMMDILRETKNSKADPQHQCINMYDIRLRDDDSCGMNWPPDLKAVTPYLRRKDVIAALHINPDKKTGWQECSGSVSANFRARKSIPSIQFLPDILASIPVVLFSGAKDMICNHLGTEALIKNLEFNGGKGFELSPGVWAPKRDWTFEGEPAGIYQEARNLTYVLFYNSSHMVPFDYPRRTRDMLDRFMNVDIGSIGGTPADSRIDGEKGPLISVGGHPNSTTAEEAEMERVKQATWKAYYKSGEVALIVVAIAAGLWGWYVWRDRRAQAGYKGLGTGGSNDGRESLMAGMGLESFRRRDRSERDVEAADFDERELDEVASPLPKTTANGNGVNGGAEGKGRRRYSQDDDLGDEDNTYEVGGESSDEDAPGRSSEKM
jgi:carboxypeptidase D